MSQEQEESWAQTLMVITPEDDAVIRVMTSSTILAGNADTPLRMDVSNITHRQTVITIRKDFIDPIELEKKKYTDVECQTYLQGVPKVEIPSLHRSEATQTMYLGKHSPQMQTFEDIMANMNEKTMPVMNIGDITQTSITFVPDHPQENVIDELQEDIFSEHQTDRHITVNVTEEEEMEMEILDNMNFVIDRVFWISDPGYAPKVKKEDAEAQTSIKYNNSSKKITFDSGTQTGLTCEPKDSNTQLLADYNETKDCIRGYLETCLETGVYPLMMVDDLMDELIDKCAEQIHFPSKEEAVQTIAPCKALEDKDEEVLRKLRLPLVIDSLEASIIVIPLLVDVLQDVCDNVHDRATKVVGDIVYQLVDKSVLIGRKLQEIRVKAMPRPMDDIFNERKKKLGESMRKSKLKDSSMQTGLAGVPDIMKIRDPRETICSTCARHSSCFMCQGTEEETEKPPEKIKILRTQDILLAYNPCYVMAIASDRVKNENLVPLRKPKEEPKKPPAILSRKKAARPTSSSSSAEIEKTPLGSKHKVIQQGSTNSMQNKSRANVNPSNVRQLGKESTQSQDGLPMQSVEALHILKNAFCNEVTCKAFAKVAKEPKFTSKVKEEKNRGHTSEERVEDSPRKCNEPCSSYKPEGDGFRIIPVVMITGSED